jgi:hypothetical protein
MMMIAILFCRGRNARGKWWSESRSTDGMKATRDRFFSLLLFNFLFYGIANIIIIKQRRETRKEKHRTPEPNRTVITRHTTPYKERRNKD